MVGINYLFPPDQIETLPTWRFVLHFPVESEPEPSLVDELSRRLSECEFNVVELVSPELVEFIPEAGALLVPLEVPEELRHQHDSLSRYESDIWKILGTFAGADCEDVYYEAVDWVDPEDR